MIELAESDDLTSWDREVVESRPGVPPEPGLDQTRGSADSWYVLASILTSILIYAAAALAFHSLYAPGPVDASEFLPEYRPFVAPEPGERLLYLLGLACIPTLPTAVYGLLRWLGRRPTGLTAVLGRPRWLMARDATLVLAVVGWLNFLASRSEIPRLPSLLTYSLVLLGFTALAAWLRPRVHRFVIGIVIAGLLLASSWLSTMNLDWLVSSMYVAVHFDNSLGAVNQVWHGRTLLVDSTSMYGILYPYIAAWTLAPFGLTVRTLSLFFAAVTLLGWVFAYAAVGRKVGYGSIATLVFTTAFLGVTQAIPAIQFLSIEPNPASPSPAPWSVYYQFVPIRTIAGLFFIWFVPIYLRTPRTWLLVAGYLAAGFWLLWNVDMGAVVLVAWFGLQGLRAIGHWRRGVARMVGRISGHAILTALTVILAVGAYLAFARLRSGQFPSLAAFVEYQRIFYTSGFAMLPMKLWEFWQPVILLYTLVIAWCLRRAIWGTLTPDLAWYFFIAIYGLGEFSYYQGRSHFHVLTTTFYPMVILSFLVAHDGWQEVRSVPAAEMLGDPRKRFVLIGVALCSIGFAFGIMNFCRAIKPALIIAAKRVPRQAGVVFPSYRRDEVSLAVETTEVVEVPPEFRRELSGKKGMVLTDAGDAVLLALGCPSSLPFASTSEVLLFRQLSKVQTALEGADTEFVLLNPEHPLARHLSIKGFSPVWQAGGVVLLRRTGP